MNKLDYGKYRGIIISIVLFLVLDASVLVMNFYMSFQIADDAIGVNIAGRQRMLSQRITKSLFDVQTSIGDETELKRSLDELRGAASLFNSSFVAFDEGGITPAPDGQPATLKPVSSIGSMQAIASAAPIWSPYLASIEQLLAVDPLQSVDAFRTQLETTLSVGRTENLNLLRYMNDLTVDLEGVARSKAEILRLIQTVGISLALLNFFIIIFHSVKQLKTSDRKIEEAQQQTQEILSTVNEGLFLLDSNGKIGDQYSAELETIMGRNQLGGTSLNDLMGSLVSQQDMITTHKFVGLLFDKSKKVRLLGSLNPLRKIEVHLTDSQGVYQSKFLSFAFSRVMRQGEIVHILVTVKDITQEIQLAAELELTKKQGEQQFEMLTSLLGGDSSLVPMYLKNSAQTLGKINSILQLPAKTHAQLIDKANNIFSLVHNFKGESAALAMEQFVDLAHQLEEQLVELKTNPALSGNDFLSLTVLLNKIISQINGAQKLMSKISSMAPTDQLSAAPPSLTARRGWEHLQNLASYVAKRQNKKVELLHSGLGDQDLPEAIQKMLSEVSVQLIRNSISHGIEDAQGRRDAEKPETGSIDIRLVRRANNSYQYSFSDDGIGLNLNSIRESALAKGLITPSQAENMDKKQIISLIFSPDLSTSENVDEDSGRGIGMASVQTAIRALGGKLSISSRRGLGCSFNISLPAQISTAAKAA